MRIKTKAVFTLYIKVKILYRGVQHCTSPFQQVEKPRNRIYIISANTLLLVREGGILRHRNPTIRKEYIKCSLPLTSDLVLYNCVKSIEKRVL